MDEEDSADVLFNENGKGKRPAASLPSDEDHSEEDAEGSEGEATDSEEDDDSLDGEDEDGEEEDMEDGCEDEEKEMEGTVGNASADLAGFSSDEDAEKCPICLNVFCDQPVATPENCAHYFCVDCIHEWAKKVNSCPVDRIAFSNILLRTGFGGEVKKRIAIKKPVDLQLEQEVDTFLEDTHCEACGGSDREDRMLLCDGCDAGYHMECLTPPLDAVPVEEWFCPQCAPSNSHTTSGGSEDESNVRPTTSRPQPRLSRPGRAIARTQHSERVRANVNRHRIMQARTAAQVAPQNLTQSTWLDETINAVLARINTGGYQRDLITRPQTRKRRRTVRRRKSRKQGKAAGSKPSTKKVKTRKRKARRSKSRRKVVAKKEITSRGRIAQNLGLKKPTRGSSIPSVYRPYEQSLSSMRAEIGAASLSIYGDPAVFSSSDDERIEQAPGPSSLLEAKFRGLSRSALRSHQPVARPITAGMSRQGHGIPQMEEVAEAAPVPDLLGSILSGQTLLLMDSSDVIINRDGSLKPTKPVCLPSSRSISASSASEMATSTGTGLVQSSRETAPFSRPLTSSSNSCVQPYPDALTPAPVSPPASRAPPSINGHLPNRLLQKQVASQFAGNGHSQQGSSGFRDQHPARVTNGTLDSHTGGRGTTLPQTPAKKPPPKPVWVDVSALPKIPKIKKESNSLGHTSTGSNTNNLPDSSMTSLAGDKGRQHSVDQQGTSTSRPDRTIDNQRQKVDKAGPSSSFSNSFSSSSLSTTVANPQPSSSSTISFRISSGRNPWHARRLSAPEPSLPVKDEESEKKNKKTRQMLLLSHCQAKKNPVKSEVYDPFDPTGSDSSDCTDEEENDNPEVNIRSTGPTIPTVGQNVGAEPQIKREPIELGSPVKDESHGMREELKKEPSSPKNNLWSLSSHQLNIRQTQIQAESLNTGLASGVKPVISDEEFSRTPESPFIKNVGHSRSSSSSSHHSAKDVKIEVKTEPDLGPSPGESLAQVPKGNGFISESSLVAGSSDASDKSKEREIRSPCFQSVSSSQSPPSKSSEHSHKKKKHSRSEDRPRSRSRSPVHRQSRSKHNERRRSRGRERSQERGRSQDRERPREKGRSRDRRHSREREHSREGEHSRTRGRSRDRGHSSSQRRSARSSSRESSRERTQNRERHEQYHSREREQQKVCKKKRNSSSNSRSRSRSRERRREQPSSRQSSSRSRDEDVKKSKRKRSTSRDRKQTEDVPHKKRSPEKTPSTSVETLLVNLSPVTCATMDTEQMTDGESPSLPVEPTAENTEAEPLHAPCAVKQEPVDSVDEDVNVEYLIDNLDFIKKEMKSESGTEQADTVEPKPSIGGEPTAVKQDSASAVAGTKVPSQGKRVTWNIQEPEVPQAERMSKLALFKMKLKQEGSRKAASFSFVQTASKPANAAQEAPNPASTSLDPAELEGVSKLDQGRSKSQKEESSDPQQKDKYLKKLHMQERAIEEVKLAIKPFYQKRDITKDEYKEILRKAVQKVCHSKSGEINPVKVANLVKAYVDKYKYARKHRKEEESGQTDSAENPRDPQSV